MNFFDPKFVMPDEKGVQQMAVRTRSSSLIWGVIILFLGVLLQLNILYPDKDILHSLWKFWPVLLIALGLSKVIHYFSAGSSPDAPTDPGKEP